MGLRRRHYCAKASRGATRATVSFLYPLLRAKPLNSPMRATPLRTTTSKKLGLLPCSSSLAG